MNRLLLILLPAVMLTGCFSAIMDDDYQVIDPELRPHLESFIAEAQARGIDVDISTLKLEFGPTGTTAQGKCYARTNQILINRNTSGWKNNPEALVFHELGHLYLGRDHRDEVLNKRPLSIMCAATSYGDPDYVDEKSYRRQYYINELFNDATPMPEWFFE